MVVTLVPDAVLAKAGAGGKVCVFTLAATDIIADVNGFVPATPTTEQRLGVESKYKHTRMVASDSGVECWAIESVWRNPADGIDHSIGSSSVWLQTERRRGRRRRWWVALPRAVVCSQLRVSGERHDQVLGQELTTPNSAMGVQPLRSRHPWKWRASPMLSWRIRRSGSATPAPCSPPASSSAGVATITASSEMAQETESEYRLDPLQ